MNTLRRHILRGAQAVDTTHRRHHYHIFPPAEQRRSSRKTQSIYLLVDTQVFINIGIGGGDVGFGLVVVVVRNEILHRVVREERLHLRIQLCRKGLVVAHDKRRAIQLCYHVRHREGLAAARNAQQHLRVSTCLDAVHQGLYRLRLVARRLVCTL